MRKRRGAIHSNDEEEFIQLSILSQKTLGIFYNDSPETKSTSVNSQSWSHFDYNKDDKMKIEEMQEQEEQSGKRITHNVMLIYQKNNITQDIVRNNLMKVLDLPNPQTQGIQALQLIIRENNKDNHVIKFWLASANYQNIFESYYRMSDTFILVFDQSQKNLSDAQIQIIASIKNSKPYFVDAIWLNQQSEPSIRTKFGELTSKLCKN